MGFGAGSTVARASLSQRLFKCCKQFLFPKCFFHRQQLRSPRHCSCGTLVRNYVQNVKAPSSAAIAPITNEVRPWAQLGNTTEFGTWLTGAELKSLLGDELRQETIVAASDRKAEAKLLLQCKAQYVARVDVNGEFLSLVDRVAFADELASKLAARLELFASSRAEAA